MTGIIYKYTSPSGKSYIGQTINPERRIIEHRIMKGDTIFHRAIKKYGFENFQYEILVTVDLEDEQELKQKLDFFEKFYIRKLHTFGENGYNMTAGGEGLLGHTVSEETKQKISESLKGNVPWNKGKTNVLSEKAKQKMREAKKGFVPWNKGKTTSEEQKKKLSEARKAYLERIKQQKSA